MKGEKENKRKGEGNLVILLLTPLPVIISSIDSDNALYPHLGLHILISRKLLAFYSLLIFFPVFGFLFYYLLDRRIRY
jgi:hypothetical protein